MSYDIPFPVETPYAMRPHMRPLQPGEPILIKDQYFNTYQQQKQRFYDLVYGDNVSLSLIEDVIQGLREFEPQLHVMTADPLRELTEALQEDFVVWAPNREGNLSAQVLSVCLPSGWDPKEKVNKTFLEIHEPIPDFDVVNRAADHIARMITQRGPFVRHVWTICNDASLSRRPENCRPWTSETLAQMWFRAERQVTVPIRNYAALFLIRVYMQPLRDVFGDPEKKQQIIDSVMSMSDAVLGYKNLFYVRDYLSTLRAV